MNQTAIRQFSTTTMENVTVGFYNKIAFIVADSDGLFTHEDIQKGVFDTGLIRNYHNVTGLCVIAELYEESDGLIEIEGKPYNFRLNFESGILASLISHDPDRDITHTQIKSKYKKAFEEGEPLDYFGETHKYYPTNIPIFANECHMISEKDDHFTKGIFEQLLKLNNAKVDQKYVK